MKKTILNLVFLSLAISSFSALAMIRRVEDDFKLNDLSQDVIVYVIMPYCDDETLGKLQLVNSFFKEMVDTFVTKIEQSNYEDGPFDEFYHMPSLDYKKIRELVEELKQKIDDYNNRILSFAGNSDGERENIRVSEENLQDTLYRIFQKYLEGDRRRSLRDKTLSERVATSFIGTTWRAIATNLTGNYSGGSPSNRVDLCELLYGAILALLFIAIQHYTVPPCISFLLQLFIDKPIHMNPTTLTLITLAPCMILALNYIYSKFFPDNPIAKLGNKLRDWIENHINRFELRAENGLQVELAKLREAVYAETEDAPACSICQENFGQTTMIHCGHRFHRNCLHEYLEVDGNHTCPTCEGNWAEQKKRLVRRLGQGQYDTRD